MTTLALLNLPAQNAQSIDLCQYLDWDSNFFGCSIARVAVNQLTNQAMQQVLSWCDVHTIDCLYLLADPNHPSTIRLAEDNGFHLMDMRVTLELKLGRTLTKEDTNNQIKIRLSRPEDIPHLQAIATTSHTDSRFYFDPNFPRARCATLYETWIEKSCAGYADAVLVVESERQIAGYLSCKIIDQCTGQIGLVAVAEQMRGKGVGHQLVTESLRWFTAQGMMRVTVVTQGRNCKAQRLYQECGFRGSSLGLWYHRWFHSAEGTVSL